MVIHFICRGNAFRSLIAEAYVNSLQLTGVEVMSSGTVAKQYHDRNVGNYQKTLGLLRRHGLDAYVKKHFGDQLVCESVSNEQTVVCLNRIAYDEARKICRLPKQTHVWDVVDLGEYGRIAHTDEERDRYMEDVYQEIVQNAKDLFLA